MCGNVDDNDVCRHTRPYPPLAAISQSLDMVQNSRLESPELKSKSDFLSFPKKCVEIIPFKGFERSSQYQNFHHFLYTLGLSRFSSE